MSDTIQIPTDRLRPGVLKFIRSSALADCSTLVIDEDRISVRPSWPVAGFSSGEQAAWRVLCSLVDALTTIRFELVSA